MQAQGAINRKKINVVVLAAKDLIAADFGGKSDPVRRTRSAAARASRSRSRARAQFVQLIVRNRGTVKQTSTKQKTLEPEYNEEFEFEVVDEINDMLDVTVERPDQV